MVQPGLDGWTVCCVDIYPSIALDSTPLLKGQSLYSYSVL